MIYQVISIAGAGVILIAYALHQTKRLHAETYSYQGLNLIGGILLCITAVAGRQYGFIILEGIWAILSAWGMVKVGRHKTSG